MQTHWRLAFMFDAPGGDLARLENDLLGAAGDIRAAARANPARLGVAIRDGQPTTSDQTHDSGSWRSVDGAIEVTLPNGDQHSAPAICQSLRSILAALAEPGSVEVMTGAMHHMVPVRPGGAFLSLAFRRDPATTVAQFRDWWLNQHSKVAIPVLGEELLAYDQVHIDTEASSAAAEALGVPFTDYDAYDNLTYRDQPGFIESIGDVDGMMRIAEDEVGRIDNSTRRYALMREVGAV